MMLWWMIAAAHAGFDCADAAKVAEVSAELTALVQEDAADRASANPKTTANDAKRAKDAQKLDESGALCIPQQKFDAAQLLMRAQDMFVAKRGNDLATEAMQAKVTNGPWLVALTFDRWRVLAGLPQRYGTATSVLADGKKCIYAVDPAATDDERTQYGIRPLGEAFQAVLTANGAPADTALTEDALRRLGWVCPKVEH